MGKAGEGAAVSAAFPARYHDHEREPLTLGALAVGALALGVFAFGIFAHGALTLGALSNGGRRCRGLQNRGRALEEGVDVPGRCEGQAGGEWETGRGGSKREKGGR